jgi:serine-type D-Ala-D-Ala carboxypeptidase (penicillin-binding protein 5/6)
MRRTLVVVAVVLGAIAAPVGATTAPPELDASAWYLVGDDGAVLAAHESRASRPIASITKLMTALVTLEHAALSDVATVPESAAGIGGSTVELRAGQQLTVAELLRAMLVPSANDAAETLALHAGRGSVGRFVALMNAKAQELGLDETNFVNPHGLDEAGHVSSAEDATILFRHALGIPFVRDALDRTSVTVNGRIFPTTDDLLSSWAPLVGGKTGHTEGAGWSEAAAARARGATVYGTVLGVRTRELRNEELQDLLDYGLGRYRRVAVIDAQRVYGVAETGYGRAAVELVPARTIVRAVHDRAPLVERVIAQSVTELPVREGDPLGRVEIYDGDRLVASSNLVATDSVSEPGVLGKALWYSGRTAANLWSLVS